MDSPASSNGGFSRPRASANNPRRISSRLCRYRSNSESMCKRQVAKAGLMSKKRKYESTYDSGQTSKSCTGCSTSKSLTLFPNPSVSAKSTDVPFSLDISDCLTDASQWEAMEIRFLENDKCTVLRHNLCQSLSLCDKKKLSSCVVSGDTTTNTTSLCGDESENTPSRRPICRQTVRVEKVHVRNLLNTNRERCGNLSSSRLSEYVPPNHESNITYNSEGMDSSETVSSIMSDSSVSSLDSRRRATPNYGDGLNWKEKMEKGVKQDSDDTEVESSEESDSEEDDDEDDDDDEEEEGNEESDESVEETCPKSENGVSKIKQSVWLKKKESDMGCSFSQNKERKSVTPKVKKKVQATESDAKNVEHLQRGSISQERCNRHVKATESCISSENIWTQNSDVIECFCSSSHDCHSDGGKLPYFSESTSNKKEDKCPASTKETVLKNIKKDTEKKREEQGLTDCHNNPLPSAASRSPKTSFTRMSDEEMTLYKQTALQILMQRKRHAQFVDRQSPKQTTEGPNHLITQRKYSSPAFRLSSQRYKQFTPRLNYARDLHRQTASGRVSGQTEKNKPRTTAIQQSSHTSTISPYETHSWQPNTRAMTIQRTGFRRRSKKYTEKLSGSLSSNLTSWSWNSENIKNVSKPGNILQRRNSTPASAKIKWPTSASKTQTPASILTTASKTMNNRPGLENKFVSVGQQTDSSASLHSEETNKKKRMTKSVQTSHVKRPHPHVISHCEYQNSTSHGKKMPKSLFEKTKMSLDLSKRLGRGPLTENRKIIQGNREKGFPTDLKPKSLSSQTMQKSVPADPQSKRVEKQNILHQTPSKEKTNEEKMADGNIPETEQPSETSTVLPLKSSSKEKENLTSSLPSHVSPSINYDTISQSCNSSSRETEQVKRKQEGTAKVNARNRLGYLELLQNILKSPTARASQALGKFLQKPDTLDATEGVNEMTVDQIINSYQEIFDEIKAMSSSSSVKGDSKQQDISDSKQDAASRQIKTMSRFYDSQNHAASNIKQNAAASNIKQNALNHAASNIKQNAAASNIKQNALSSEKVIQESSRESKEPVTHTKLPATDESKKREGQRFSPHFQNRSRSCQDWAKNDKNPKATNKSSPSVLLPQPTGKRVASNGTGNKFHHKTVSQQSTKCVVWKTQAPSAKATVLQQKVGTGETTTFAGPKQVKTQDAPLKNQINRASVISSSGFKLSVKSPGDQQSQTENPLPSVYVIGASRHSDHKMLILSNPTSGPMLVKSSIGHASVPPVVSKSYPTVVSKNEAYLIRGTYLTFGQEDSSIVKIEDLKTGNNQLRSPRQGRSMIKKYIRTGEPYQEDSLKSLRTCPTITIIAPQACVNISPKKSSSIDVSSAGAAIKKHENDQRKNQENVKSMKSKSGVSTATQTRSCDKPTSNWAPNSRFKLHTGGRVLSKKESLPTPVRDYTAQNETPKASLNSTLEGNQLKSCTSSTQTQDKYASKKNEPKQRSNTHTLLANRHGNQNQPRINLIRKNQSADTLKHQPFTPQSPMKQLDRSNLRDTNKPKQTDAAVARARNMHITRSNTNSIVHRVEIHRRPTRCLSRTRDKLCPRLSETDKQLSGSHCSRLTNSNIKLNPNLIRQKLPGGIISSVNNTDTPILKDRATNSKSAATCFLSSSRYQNLSWWAKKPKYNTKKCLSASNVQERIKPNIMSSLAWKNKPYEKINRVQMCKIQPVGGIQPILKVNSIEKNLNSPALAPNLISNTPNTATYSSSRLTNTLPRYPKLKWPLTFPMPAGSNNLKEEDIQNQILTEKCEHAVMKSQSQSVDRIIDISGFSPFMGKKNKQGKEPTLRKSTSCVNVFKISKDTRMPQTKISRESNVIKTSTERREEHFKSSVSVMEAGDNTLWLSRHRKKENHIDESIKSTFLYNKSKKDEGFNETNIYKNGSSGHHKKSNFSEDDSEASDWGNLQNLRQHAVAKTCEMILHETKKMIDPRYQHQREDESQVRKVEHSSIFPFNDIKERAANSSMFTGMSCVQEKKKKYPGAFQSHQLPTLKSFKAIQSLQKSNIGTKVNTCNDRKSPCSEDSTDSSAPTEAVREEKETIKTSYGLQTSSENLSLVSGRIKKNIAQFYITKEQPKSLQTDEALPKSTKEKDYPQFDRSQLVTANAENKNLIDESVALNLKRISNVALNIPGPMDTEDNSLEKDSHSWPKCSQRKSTQAGTVVSRVIESNVDGFKERENAIKRSRWLPENKLKSLVTAENTVLSSQSVERNLTSTETQTDIPETACRECFVQRALPELQMGQIQHGTDKELETKEPIKTIPVVEKTNVGWEETFTCKDRQSVINYETFEVTTDEKKQSDKQCDEKALVFFPIARALREDLVPISTLEIKSTSGICHPDDVKEKTLSSSISQQKNFYCYQCPTKAITTHEKDGRQSGLFLTNRSNTEKITEQEVLPNSDVVLLKGQFRVICDSKGNRGDLKELNSDLTERISELCPKCLATGRHEQGNENYLLNSNAGMPKKVINNELLINTEDQEVHPQAAFDYTANGSRATSTSELGLRFCPSEDVASLEKTNLTKSDRPLCQSTGASNSKPSWKQLPSNFVKCFSTWIASCKEHDMFEQQSLFGSSSFTLCPSNQFQSLLPRDVQDTKILKSPFDYKSKLRLGATDLNPKFEKRINVLKHKLTRTSNTVRDKNYLSAFDNCRQSSSMKNFATYSHEVKNDRMIKTENGLTCKTKPSHGQITKGKSDALEREFCHSFDMKKQDSKLEIGCYCQKCTPAILKDDIVIKNTSETNVSQRQIIDEHSEGWKPVEEMKSADRDLVVKDSLITESGTERQSSRENLNNDTDAVCNYDFPKQKGESVIQDECFKEHRSTKYSEDVSKPKSLVQSATVCEPETDMETVTCRRSFVESMATHLPPVCSNNRDKRGAYVVRKFSSKHSRTSSPEVQDSDQEKTCRRSSSVTELVNTTSVVMEGNNLLCTSDEKEVVVQNIKLTDNEIRYHCKVMDNQFPSDSQENTVHSYTISDFNLSTSVQKSSQKRKPLLSDLNICEIYEQLHCNNNKQEKNDKSKGDSYMSLENSTHSNENASVSSENVDKKHVSKVTQDKRKTTVKDAHNSRILLRHKGMDYKLIHQKAMENLESFLRSIQQGSDKRGSRSLLSSPPKKPCRENTRRYGSFPVDKLDVKTSHSCCFQQSVGFTDCATLNVNEPVGPHSVFSLMTIEAEKTLKNAKTKTASEPHDDSSKPAVNKEELIDSLICMNEHEVELLKNNVPPLNDVCQSFIVSPAGLSEEIYHSPFMISQSHKSPKEPCFQSTVCKNRQSQEPPLPIQSLALADLGMSKESSPVPLKPVSGVTHSSKEVKYKPLFHSAAISNQSPTSFSDMGICAFSSLPLINSPNAHPRVHEFSQSPQEVSKNPFSPLNANPFLRQPSPLPLPKPDCIATKCIEKTCWGQKESVMNVKTLLQRSPTKLPTTACNSFGTCASPNFTHHQCLLPDSVPVNFGLSGEEIESFFCNTSVKEAEGSSEKQMTDKMEHDIFESDIVKGDSKEETECLMLFSDSLRKYPKTSQPAISGPSHAQLHMLKRRNNYKHLSDSASQLSVNMKPKTKTYNGIPSPNAGSNDICVFKTCHNQLCTHKTKHVKIISQLNDGDSYNWQQDTHQSSPPDAPLREASHVHTLTDDACGILTEKSQEQAPHSSSSDDEDSNSCQSYVIKNYSTSASTESLSQFCFQGDQLLHTPVLNNSDLSRESESADMSWNQCALSRTSSTSSSTSSQVLRSASLFPCSETPLLSKGTKSHNALDKRGFFTLQLCDKAEKGPRSGYSKEMHHDILKTVTTLTSQVIYIFSDLKDKLNGTPEKGKHSRTFRSRRGRRLGKSTRKKNRSSRSTSGSKKKTLFRSSDMSLCFSDNTTITHRKNLYPSEVEPYQENSKRWKRCLKNRKGDFSSFSNQPKDSILKKWVENTAATFGIAAKDSSSLNNFSRMCESLPVPLSKSSEILPFKTMTKNLKYQRCEGTPIQLSSHTDLTKKRDGVESPPVFEHAKDSSTLVKPGHASPLTDDEEFTKCMGMVNGRQNYNQDMEKEQGDDFPSDLVNSMNDNTYVPLSGFQNEKEYPTSTETFQENNYSMLPYFYTAYFLNNVFPSNTLPPFAFLPPLLVAVEERESKKEPGRRQIGLGNFCQSKRLIHASVKDNVDVGVEDRIFFVDDLDLDHESGFKKFKREKISPPPDNIPNYCESRPIAENIEKAEDSLIQPKPKLDFNYVFTSKENEPDWVDNECAQFSSGNVCKRKRTVSEDSIHSCHYTQTVSGFLSPKCTYDCKEKLKYPNCTGKLGRLNNDSKSFTMHKTSPPKRHYETNRRKDSKKSSSFLRTCYCFSDKSPVLERKIKHINDRPYHSDEELGDINSSTHNNIPHPKNYMSQQNDAFYGTKPLTQTCSCRGYEHPVNTIIYRVGLDSTPLSAIQSEFNEDNKRMAYSEIKMKPSVGDEYTADLNEPDTYDELISLCTEILETTPSSSCSDDSTVKSSDSFSCKDYSLPHFFQLGKRSLSCKGSSLSIMSPCHARKLTLTPLHRSAPEEPSKIQFQDKEKTYTAQSRHSKSKDCNVSDALISGNKSVQAALKGLVDSERSNLTACSKPISSFTQDDRGNIADTLSVTENKTRTLSEINRFISRCVKSTNFNHHIENIVDNRLQKTLESMSLKCIADPTDDMEKTRFYFKLPSMFGHKENAVKSCTRAASQRRKTDSPACSKVVDMVITAERFVDDFQSENDLNSSNRESVRISKTKMKKEGKECSYNQRYRNIEGKGTKLLSDLKNERSTASFERERKPLFAQGNIHTILRKYSSPPKCSRFRNGKRGYKRKKVEKDTRKLTISPFSSYPVTSKRKTDTGSQGNISLPIIPSLKRDNIYNTLVENKTSTQSKTINRACMTSPVDGTGVNHLTIQTHHIVDSSQKRSNPVFKTQIHGTLSSPKAIEAMINCSNELKRPQSYNWRKDQTYVNSPSTAIYESFETSSSSSLKYDYGELGNVLSAESKLLWNKISCLENNYERCKMCRKRYRSIIGKRDRRIMAASKNKSLGQSSHFFKKRNYLNISKDKYNESESQKVREKIDEHSDFLSRTTTTLQTAKVSRFDTQADLRCNLPKISNLVVDNKPFLTDPCSLSQEDNECCSTGRKSEDLSVEKLTDPTANRSSTKSLTFNVDQLSVPEELRRTYFAKHDETQKKKRNMKGAHTAQMVRLFETGEAFLNDKKTDGGLAAVEKEVGSLKGQKRYNFANSKWNSLASSDQNQSKSVEMFETEEEPWQPRWKDDYSVKYEGCFVTSVQTGNERPVKKAEKYTCKLPNKHIYDLHLNYQLSDSTYFVVPAFAENSLQEQTDTCSPTDCFIERLVDILDEMHQIFPQTLFPCRESEFPVLNRSYCSSGRTDRTETKNERILRQRPNQLSRDSASKVQFAAFSPESVLKTMDDNELLRSKNNKPMFPVQYFKTCNPARADSYTQVLNGVIKDDENTTENDSMNVPNYSANCHETIRDRSKTFSFFISSQEPYNEMATSHVTVSDNPLHCRYQTWVEDIPDECNENCQNRMKENDSFPKSDEEKMTFHISDSLTFSPTFRCHDWPHELLVQMDKDERPFRSNYQKSRERERPLMSTRLSRPNYKNRSCHAKFSVQGEEESLILLEDKTQPNSNSNPDPNPEREMPRTNHEICYQDQSVSFFMYGSKKVQKTRVRKDSKNDLDLTSEHQKCTSNQDDLTNVEKNVEEWETESSRLFSISKYLAGLYMLSTLDKQYVYMKKSQMNCYDRSFTDICKDKNSFKKSNSFSCFDSLTSSSGGGVIDSLHCAPGSVKKEKIEFIPPLWNGDVKKEKIEFVPPLCNGDVKKEKIEFVPPLWNGDVKKEKIEFVPPLWNGDVKKEKIEFVPPLWNGDVKTQSNHDIKTDIQHLNQEPVRTPKLPTDDLDHESFTKNPKTSNITSRGCHSKKFNLNIETTGNFSYTSKALHREQHNSHNTPINPICQANSNVRQYRGRSPSLSHLQNKQTIREILTDKEVAEKEAASSNTDSITSLVKTGVLLRHAEDINNIDGECPSFAEHKDNDELFAKWKLYRPVGKVHSLDSERGCQDIGEHHEKKSCSKMYVPAASQCTDGLESQEGDCFLVNDYFPREAFEKVKNFHTTPIDPNNKPNIKYTSKQNTSEQSSKHRPAEGKFEARNNSSQFQEIPIDIYTVPLRKSWSLNKKKKTKKCEDLQTRTIVISGPIMNFSVPVHRHNLPNQEDEHHLGCCCNGMDCDGSDTRQTEFADKSTTDCNESRKMNSKWRDAMRRILPFGRKN